MLIDFFSGFICPHSNFSFFFSWFQGDRERGGREGSRGSGEGPQDSRLSGPPALFCSGRKPRLFHCLVPPDAAAALPGPDEQI